MRHVSLNVLKLLIGSSLLAFFAHAPAHALENPDDTTGAVAASAPVQETPGTVAASAPVQETPGAVAGDAAASLPLQEAQTAPDQGAPTDAPTSSVATPIQARWEVAILGGISKYGDDQARWYVPLGTSVFEYPELPLRVTYHLDETWFLGGAFTIQGYQERDDVATDGLPTVRNTMLSVGAQTPMRDRLSAFGEARGGIIGIGTLAESDRMVYAGLGAGVRYHLMPQAALRLQVGFDRNIQMEANKLELAFGVCAFF